MQTKLAQQKILAECLSSGFLFLCKNYQTEHYFPALGSLKQKLFDTSKTKALAAIILL